MKNCIKCGVEKELSFFYKHPQMKDGHLNKCKECAKSDVKKNYASNIDHFKAYEKTRTHAPHRVQARKDYAKTPGVIKAGNMAKMKWDHNHHIQKAASTMVGNALRSGRIRKDSCCSNCYKKSTRLEGHHDDYAFPLVVRWLCSKCHYDWHELNQPLNGDD